MKRCIYFVSVLLVSMGLLIGSIARAQALRDPTLAPAAPGSGPDGATVSSSSPLGDAGVAVVVRSGKSVCTTATTPRLLAQQHPASSAWKACWPGSTSSPRR